MGERHKIGWEGKGECLWEEVEQGIGIGSKLSVQHSQIAFNKEKRVMCCTPESEKAESTPAQSDGY